MRGNSAGRVAVQHLNPAAHCEGHGGAVLRIFQHQLAVGGPPVIAVVVEGRELHGGAILSHAAGLMVIPRVLSRGNSPTAQRHHFKAILAAAPGLPAVIYNSPYYGFETKADLFFALRAEHPNLVGFKEFGGAKAMSYAAEYITSADETVILMAGVDTGVYHGYVKCGATGTITGIGNCIPTEVLHFVALAKAAATGDLDARTRARELGEALEVLSTWDEGSDLVLYYKHMMVLQGDAEYALHFNETDELTASQRVWAETQFTQFKTWYAEWNKLPGAVQKYRA